MHRRSILRALTLAAGAVMAPRAARTASTRRMAIALGPSTPFAPVLLAARSPALLNENVEAKTVLLPQDQRHLAAANYVVDGVVTTVDAYVRYAAAGVVLPQVLAVSTSTGGEGICAVSSVEDVASLTGKRVAVDRKGTTLRYMLSHILRKSHISEAGLNILEGDAELAAHGLATGRCDAAVTTEGYISAIQTALPETHTIATTREYPCIVYSLAFTEEYLDQNMDVVKLFIDEVFSATKTLQTSPEKEFDVMARELQISVDRLRYETKLVDWHSRTYNTTNMKKVLRSIMAEAVEVGLGDGSLSGPVDTQRLIDASFTT